MNYKQWIITWPNTRLIPEVDQPIAASTRIEVVGTMRRCQIRDIGSQLHVPLSPTNGNVTRLTFLSHLFSLSLPSSGYKKNKKKTQGRTVYSRLFIVIYWIFVIASSVFRTYLWNGRSGNNEFSVQLQSLWPRLIGHWTFLCLYKRPLCRLKGYNLWSKERKNKAH